MTGLIGVTERAGRGQGPRRVLIPLTSIAVVAQHEDGYAIIRVQPNIRIETVQQYNEVLVAIAVASRNPGIHYPPSDDD